MAWSAPMTAVANAAFTAAQFNTYVRDNLNETAPAKATAANRIFVSTGANAIAEREILNEFLTTAQTSTSTAYADLATVGPDITITTGTAALVGASCTQSVNSAAANVYMSWAFSGASTVAASDDWALQMNSDTSGQTLHATSWYLHTGLTAGSNTITAKYRVTAGTGTWSRRSLIVIAL